MLFGMVPGFSFVRKQSGYGSSGIRAVLLAGGNGERIRYCFMKKGTFGYLKSARKKSLIKSGLFLAAVLIVYFAALFHYKTNKNVFSILAAVGALPTGRSIVLSIMLLRAKGASERVFEAVEKVGSLPEGCSGYDLYLTGYEKSFSLSHAAVLDRTVVGLTEDEKTDCTLCEKHIRDMVKKDSHVGYETRVFRDLAGYTEELKKLSAAESDPEDREVMNMIFGISL